MKKYEQRKKRRSIRSEVKVNETIKNHNREIIELSYNIDFEENIEKLVKFTKDVNHLISGQMKKNFTIDHKNIKNISIGGLLYLVGQISKITTAKYNDGKYHLKYNKKFGLPNNDRMKYLFNEIGYWEYFGIKRPYKIAQNTKDNYFLSIETSNKSNIELLNKIKSFVNDKVDFMRHDYSIEYQFDDAIKEAMGNSIEHAYHDDFSEVGKIKGTWWICGHYDKQQKSLELVFYDYGIGIRKSINYNLGEEAEKILLDKLNEKILVSDADLIEIAIKGELAKYKNYKDHDRGKGFKRFKNFAKAAQHNCELTIVSSKGKYKFSYNASTNEELESKVSLSNPIDGMFIKWKIYL